ncbi:MAG: dCTP deaminase [Candidatus Omnitrophota bacterium]
MMIKHDSWIKKKAVEEGMIEPFADRQVSDGRVSYGLSSYGYDIRVADEFKVFAAPKNSRSLRDFSSEDKIIINPKNFDARLFSDFKGDACIIPAGSFILARSFEYFRIPDKVLAICVGKSTYCRCGVIVNVSPLEPTWEGYLTMEISNTSPFPVMIYSNEGIAQLIFFEGSQAPDITYKDRKGKYQKQLGIVLPKVNPVRATGVSEDRKVSNGAK